MDREEMDLVKRVDVSGCTASMKKGPEVRNRFKSSGRYAVDFASNKKRELNAFALNHFAAQPRASRGGVAASNKKGKLYAFAFAHFALQNKLSRALKKPTGFF